jgi:hypothetical protein
VSVVCRASVVVAVEASADNVADVMAALQPEANPDLEFIIVHPSDGAAFPAIAHASNVRQQVAAPGALIPHMWRDGFLAARAELVATLSAHCVPAPGWVAGLRALAPAEDVAGIGGHIINDRGASASDWAIYLLRYANYSQPRNLHSVRNIAADNAVYRRSAVLACQDLLPQGFWEPEYHVRFFASGQRLERIASLPAIHRNRYTPARFAAQRRAHGREFGRDRSRHLSRARLAVLAAATPLIPLVLYIKVLGAAHRAGLLGAAPLGSFAWLAKYVGAWCRGEIAGIFDELRRRLSW